MVLYSICVLDVSGDQGALFTIISYDSSTIPTLLLITFEECPSCYCRGNCWNVVVASKRSPKLLLKCVSPFTSPLLVYLVIEAFHKSFDDLFLDNRVRSSYCRSVTYSFGSISLASLLVALLELINTIVRAVFDNALLRCIFGFILSFMSQLMEYFNK